MRRVALIGSHAFLLDAMPFALKHAANIAAVWVIDSGADIGTELRRSRPDVVILDGTSETDRVFECLPLIRASAGTALLIIVVEHPSLGDRDRAIDAGTVVCAWPRSARRRARDSRPATRKGRRLRVAGESGIDARRRRPALTDRELEMLAWVAEGHTNAFIAHKLWVTEQTVKFHLTNIYRKLHVANRTAAAHHAIELGLVPRPTHDSDLAEPAQRTQQAADPRGPFSRR